MKEVNRISKGLILLTLAPRILFGELSISEKRALLADAESKNACEFHSEVVSSNRNIKQLREQLKAIYSTSDQNLNEEDQKELLAKAKQVRKDIAEAELKFKEVSEKSQGLKEEGYAHWDLEDTTLAGLVLEYGSMDFLYVIPPEMASLKIHLHSMIPIPRESWDVLLETILRQNGVGVKQLSPYVKQLYILKQSLSSVSSVIAATKDLEKVDPSTRIFYLLSPPLEESRAVFQFLERFSDSKQTFIYQIGSQVAIVSSREEVEKLLDLYQAVWEEKTGRISRVVPLSKIPAKEMEKILSSFFGEHVEKSRTFFGKVQQDRLSIFSLSQGNSLVLVGSGDLVDRAENVCRETEHQLKNPAEMSVFTYTCRHSDPVEIAEILEKIYTSLLSMPSHDSESDLEVTETSSSDSPPVSNGLESQPPLQVRPPSPPAIKRTQLDIDKTADHFIPDPKTGGLMMVIRRDAYPKIRDLLRRLDVPKKMVQLEVLLFEKSLVSSNSQGVNLLKLGNMQNSVKFGGSYAPQGRGVLEFLFGADSSKCTPAFDLAYSFMLSQEDVQLNASPSVLTVNQTPATISIVEEISINNGATRPDPDKSNYSEKSYSRAQYGITIVLTPTVHHTFDEDDLGDEDGFITLQSNITFDTPKGGVDDRPLIDRRHVENEVRVPDGQTIILGGLRKKSKMEKRDKIPLLGDLPGIGKLFGSTSMMDANTEMFIFITPKIILDPKEELEKIRIEELKKRPGDLPEVLDELNASKERKHARQIEESIHQLGR